MLAHHYLRLGLSPSVTPATRAQLSAAYRAAALKHHPDRGGSASAFAAIRESYEFLDAHARASRPYQPASLRSFARPNYSSDNWALFGSVLLPSAVGLAVGIRLMYTGSERSGLRAGGTSRVMLDATDAYCVPTAVPSSVDPNSI